MPPVAAAISFQVVLAGGWSAFITGALIRTAISFALSGLAKMLAPKPKTAGRSGVQNSGITQQVRQAIITRKPTYGEMRRSGGILFIGMSESNKYLHMVVEVAPHEVSEIGEIWLNDYSIPPDWLDANGNVTQGRYNNLVRIRKYLGTAAQTADSFLTAECPQWTSNHRLRGIAYIYIRMQWDADKFPSGVPNISAWVRGKKVYDPRTTLTTYSENPALILNDYLQDPTFGLAADSSEVDETYTTAAANVCDEFVTVTDYDTTVSSIDSSSDIITIAASSNSERLYLQRGDKVNVTSTYGLPYPLEWDTDYYVIPYQRKKTLRLKLATSYADALAGTAIDFTETAFTTTNIATYSQQFDNASWTKGAASISADATTAPDATTTADELIEDGTTASHQMTQSVSHDVGKKYTWSIYAKANTRSYIRMSMSPSRFDAHNAFFDISVGSVVSSTGCTATITGIGSGWYRCSVTATCTSSGSGNVNVRLSDDGVNSTYAGDGTSSAYFWGAQVEAQNKATTYVPTTSTSASVTGTGTITKIAEPRYAGSIVIDSEENISENIKDILGGMIGDLAYSSGVFKMQAGAYQTPVVYFDESNIVSSISVTTKLSMRERFNTVKGVYVSQINDGEPTDYPAVTNSTYVTEDLEPIVKQIDMSMTTRPHMSQRIAKIALERSRQEISWSAEFDMSALQVIAGDNAYFTIDKLGWSNKIFRIENWEFIVKDDGDSTKPVIRMNMREIASANFDWNNGEETSIDPAPDTTLPDPFDIAAVTGLGISTETIETTGGDTAYKILMQWNASNDYFVYNGGFYEIEYKKSTESTYRPTFRIDGTFNFAEVTVAAVLNEEYDIRIRAVNSLGVRSAYTSILNYLVGTSGGVGSTEDWGDFVTSPSSSEDWGDFVTSPPTTTEDWGFYT